MADSFRQFNKTMFNLLPFAAWIILTISLLLSAAWLTGYFVEPLHERIGRALNFRYNFNEILFFALLSLGSLAALGFHRLFRDYVANR